MKNSIGAKPVVYPTPVFVVGTYDKDGNANVMTASWGGICCSSPPCVAVSLRKATYTYGNITVLKAFTVNIPSESYVKEADYFGIVSGKNINKLDATGLTPIKSELINAPYIKEFPFVLECKVINIYEIGLHTQFIGEIMDVKVDDAVTGEEGHPDICKIKPFLFDPSNRAYYAIGKYLGKSFSIGKEL